MWSDFSRSTYTRDDSESSSNASLEATEEFDFNLPSHFTTDIVEAIDETKASDQAKLPIQSIADLTSLTIVRSRWYKDSTAGKTKSSFEATFGRPTHSEFTWYHVERVVKNFLTLHQLISQIPGLSLEERDEARGFLVAARENHEKRRAHGCELRPFSFVKSSDDATDRLPIAFTALETFQHRLLQQQGSISVHDHPVYPLLEHKTHQKDWSREREQVLHLKDGTRQDVCLYISSCWLLLIAGHLISISDVPYSALLSPQSLKIQPLAATIPSSPPTLVVTYGNRCWEVPLEACARWPCLIATFLDAFAQRAWGLNFMQGSTILDSKAWSKLRNRISEGPLKLQLARSASEKSDVMDTLQHEVAAFSTIKANGAYESTGELSPKDRASNSYHSNLYDRPLLRIFSLTGLPGDGPVASNIANHLHGVLLHGSMKITTSAYHKCSHAKLGDIDEWLSQSLRTHSQIPKIVCLKAELAIYIKHTYSFFWPWELEHEMLMKFWFMLRRFLEYPHDDVRRDRTSNNLWANT